MALTFQDRASMAHKVATLRARWALSMDRTQASKAMANNRAMCNQTPSLKSQKRCQASTWSAQFLSLILNVLVYLPLASQHKWQLADVVVECAHAQCYFLIWQCLMEQQRFSTWMYCNNLNEKFTARFAEINRGHRGSTNAMKWWNS